MATSNINFNAKNGLSVAGTEVVDGSRNLRNITSGNITGNLDIGGDVNLTGVNKTFKVGGVGITSTIAALSIALGEQFHFQHKPRD